MKFKKVFIEITNICNLTCNFCPKTQRMQRFMDLDLFKKILDELQGFTQYVYFHVLGEPLMHSKLEEFLELCSEKNFKVTITTNGTLLDEKNSERLFKPALRQINISLHSFEANEQGIDFEVYLEKVINFIFKASERHPQLYINLRLWNISKGEGGENNVLVLKRLQEVFTEVNVSSEQMQAGKSITLKERVFLNYDVKFTWPDLQAPLEGEKGFCYGLRNQIGILVDGTVIPCCLDREGIIRLGNIQEKPLKEILVTSRAQDLIKGFSQGRAEEELCRRCGFRVRFN